MSEFPFQPLTEQARKNFRNLYFDIAWFGILVGSTASFLGIYATRLGASSFHIGLLSALPAIVNLIVTLPAGRWLEGRPLIWASFWSSVWQRLGYLAFIPLPILFIAPVQIFIILGIIFLMSIPGTILPISFNAVFAEIVPPSWLAYVVGRRNALSAICLSVVAYLSGVILDRADFPYNYQAVFLIGAVGALMSSVHVGKLRRDSEPVPPIEHPIKDLLVGGFFRFFTDFCRVPRYLSPRQEGKPLVRFDLLRGPFGLFMASYFFFYTFQFAPFPLLPPYFVHDLGLSDGQISLGTAIFHFTVMAVSLRLGWISARLGHRRVLVWGGILFGFYPVLIYLARGAELYWVASLFGGMIWALLAGGLINRLMERVPVSDRPAHMALHNMALNLGILAGSLLGPLLGDWLGMRNAILSTAFMRVIAGFMFLLWG